MPMRNSSTDERINDGPFDWGQSVDKVEQLQDAQHSRLREMIRISSKHLLEPVCQRVSETLFPQHLLVYLSAIWCVLYPDSLNVG